MKKDDSQLQIDVEEELKWTPSVTASEIGVAVNNGVVMLSGEVRTYAAKRAAERAALQVEGVKSIATEIKVRRSEAIDDQEIAESVSKSLKWNVFVPKTVRATVQDGWVTLVGEVHRGYQKEAAEEAVNYLDGVRGVRNKIAVVSEPPVVIKDVQQNIKSALERNALIDAGNIRVDAIGDKVVLSGDVRSWTEREQAESAAWGAPGVCHVENEIAVNA